MGQVQRGLGVEVSLCRCCLSRPVPGVRRRHRVLGRCWRSRCVQSSTGGTEPCMFTAAVTDDVEVWEQRAAGAGVVSGEPQRLALSV